jgi:ribosomal protein S18 acetylase RimI-like enzyme
MKADIIIAQDSDITDMEIENLRTSVGWDNNTGSFSILKPRLFTYFTARKNDRLIGFIDVLSDGIADSYLQDLMVHPEHQKNGIGSELMRRAITFLQGKNIKCIQVTFNPEHEPFYRKFGFYIFRAGIIDRDTMNVMDDDLYNAATDVNVRKGQTL